MDDFELIERTLQGDAHAFTELIRRHQDVAFRVAYLLTGSETEAHDVLQDALLKAYLGLKRLRDASAFRGWLLRIVTNEARNRRRADLRWDALLVRAGPPGGPLVDPEAAAVRKEEHDRLLAAVLRLPERDRFAVTTRYFLGLNEAEMAEMLGWPKGSVKSRLSRALAKLRAVLTENTPEPVMGQARGDGHA